MRLEATKLRDIRVFIPALLRPKFKQLGIKTVAELLALVPVEFVRMQGVGQASRQRRIELQTLFTEQPRKLIEHMEKAEVFRREKI
jgi:hypothetical protein